MLSEEQVQGERSALVVGEVAVQGQASRVHEGIRAIDTMVRGHGVETMGDLMAVLGIPTVPDLLAMLGFSGDLEGLARDVQEALDTRHDDAVEEEFAAD